MIEQDHAVGHVLLESLPGESSRTSLGGDDRGDTPVLEPPEEAAQFGAQQSCVRQTREEALDGVEHHALGPDAVDGMPETHEEPFEVVLARLLDLRSFNAHKVDDELLLGGQAGQVKAKRCDVLRELRLGLLEGHEDTVLAHLDTAYEEFDGKEGLSCTRATADEGRASTRKASARDLVETADTAPRLGKGRHDLRLLHPHGLDPSAR